MSIGAGVLLLAESLLLRASTHIRRAKNPRTATRRPSRIDSTAKKGLEVVGWFEKFADTVTPCGRGQWGQPTERRPRPSSDQSRFSASGRSPILDAGNYGAGLI